MVQRCLAKDPEQRFQSARDLAFALEALRGPPGPRRALEGAPGPPGRWLLTGAALSLGLALPGGATGEPLSERAPPPPRVQMLTFRRGSVLGARFAPDGRTVHYSAAWNGAPPQVYSTSVESPESRPLGFGDAQLLAVSPSGELALSLRPRLILFDASRGTLARVSPLGEVPREMATNVEYADWSPDGTQLAVTRLEGGQSRLEFPLGKVIFEAKGWVSHPRISPDGKRIAFVHHARPPTPPASDGGGRLGSGRGLEPGFDELLGLAWEPDGKSLLVTGSLNGSVDFLWRVRRGRAPSSSTPHRGTCSSRTSVGAAAPWSSRPTGDRRSRWSPPTGSSGRWSGSTGGSWSTLPGRHEGADVRGRKGRPRETVLLLRDVAQTAPVKLGAGPPLALSPDGRWAVTIDKADPPNLLWSPPAGRARRLPSSGLARIDRGDLLPRRKPAGVHRPVEAGRPDDGVRLRSEDRTDPADRNRGLR